jgi:hypothetical protein
MLAWSMHATGVLDFLCVWGGEARGYERGCLEWEGGQQAVGMASMEYARDRCGRCEGGAPLMA